MKSAYVEQLPDRILVLDFMVMRTKNVLGNITCWCGPETQDKQLQGRLLPATQALLASTGFVLLADCLAVSTSPADTQRRSAEGGRRNTNRLLIGPIKSLCNTSRSSDRLRASGSPYKRCAREPLPHSHFWGNAGVCARVRLPRPTCRGPEGWGATGTSRWRKTPPTGKCCPRWRCDWTANTKAQRQWATLTFWHVAVALFGMLLILVWMLREKQSQ